MDDSPVLVELARLVLDRAGFEVLTAASGGVGLQSLRAAGSRPDVVLTDIDLPDVSGVELARILQAEYPGLPVLLTSGSSYESLPIGADGSRPAFLAKPWTPALLVERIVGLLPR